jgi:hypothetical protein
LNIVSLPSIFPRATKSVVKPPPPADRSNDSILQTEEGADSFMNRPPLPRISSLACAANNAQP